MDKTVFMHPIALKLGIKIDSKNYHLLELPGWYLDNSVGYIKRTLNNKQKRTSQYLHRLILSTDLHVDHINGDRLDNREINLRECTPHQNTFNRIIQKNNKAGLKGVHKDFRYNLRRPWIANIMLDRKTIYLGNFATKEEASKAYIIKSIELFGKFAKGNI